MNAVRAAVRRGLDLLLVAAAFPLWATVFGVCWFAVLVTTGSPVFFRQDRVGRNGRVFEVWKFRSMVVGDNPLVPEPSRITPIGSILRRISLDELPQLINVVRGDMSLVGPRPMLPSQVELLSPEQRGRHLVRPGLTGRAQVNGRNAIAWHERIEHDRAWAKEPTIRAYLSILVRTVRWFPCRSISFRRVRGSRPNLAQFSRQAVDSDGNCVSYVVMYYVPFWLT